MEIIVKKDFDMNGHIYIQGEVLKVSRENIDKIWSLNEKGFIEPLSLDKYKRLRRDILNPKKKDEEVLQEELKEE